MRIGRAVGISVVAYIATSIIGFAIMAALGVDPSAMTEIPLSAWYSGMITAAVVLALAAWWYFRSPQVVAGAKHGFLFGFTAVIVSFILDMLSIFLIPSPQSPSDFFTNYYGHPLFWVTLVVILLVTTLVGKQLSRSQATV